ncbi:DUF4822 domain-containing protein [Sphingobacterium sp. ML3W]|uniref:DUF4822 domain-containing protein n=1 Tax=Sphingobacterium sp. ML3W TaxID=1538644 RepID=UPI002499D228|nr:DUF4822 domain-containing protein [Sphingobacterium sp. ML3W]WFA81649.1 DUF4822 domain-containing protein [Sphingobacterium sp. ML3W]
MRDLKKVALVCCIAICTLLVMSCSKDDEVTPEPQLTPSEVLASTAWETTSAKNNKGENVVLTDANVSNFVGFAYFKSDGTFTMFNLDDSPKMRGDWSVSADGKTRTIVAKNAAGETLFTRVVDITVLTKNEFTYRIYPNNDNKTVYFDIIHTPTTHKEPK